MFQSQMILLLLLLNFFKRGAENSIKYMDLEGKTDKVDVPIVKRSLTSWIFDGNVKLQVMLVAIILLTVATRVVPLEMQKRIVNEAINLRKIELLGIYCSIYLVAVVLASGLKLIINIIQTKISQKTTAEMRKQLYHHILNMPLSFFRNTQPGTVVNSLINELTIPGNFVGMAVAVPLTNIVTLIASIKESGNLLRRTPKPVPFNRISLFMWT